MRTLSPEVARRTDLLEQVSALTARWLRRPLGTAVVSPRERS